MDLIRAKMHAILHEGYVPPKEGTILDFDEVPPPILKHLRRIPWKTPPRGAVLHELVNHSEEAL